MNDQALQVLNSYIPATQWAVDYLNQAINRGVSGFKNPPNTDDPLQLSLNKVPGRKHLYGLMTGLFGQQAVEHPQLNFSGEMSTEPLITNALEQLRNPDLAKAAQEARSARLFGQNLQAGGMDTLKQVSPNKYINTAPTNFESANQPPVTMDDFIQAINNARKLIRKGK